MVIKYGTKKTSLQGMATYRGFIKAMSGPHTIWTEWSPIHSLTKEDAENDAYTLLDNK